MRPQKLFGTLMSCHRGDLMVNLELVEATLPDSGFSFYITKLPEELKEDKLALASPETGVICRM